MVRIKKNNYAYNKNIYQCIAPGCENIDNEDDSTSNVLFYIISENGLNPNLIMDFLGNIPIRPKVSRLCSEHFTDDCFQLYEDTKMLKPTAVPTIKTKLKLKTLSNVADRRDVVELKCTKTDIEKHQTIDGEKEVKQPVERKQKKPQLNKKTMEDVITRPIVFSKQKQNRQKAVIIGERSEMICGEKNMQQQMTEEQIIKCGQLIFESCKNHFSFSCSFCPTNTETINSFSSHLIRLHCNEMENEINARRNNDSNLTLQFERRKMPDNDKKKCGNIYISSNCKALQDFNCDIMIFSCNFCDEKSNNLIEFSEHIGKTHLDLLEKDKENYMDFEDELDIDPSCFLSFDQIDIEMDELNPKASSKTKNENTNRGIEMLNEPFNSNQTELLEISPKDNHDIKNTKSDKRRSKENPNFYVKKIYDCFEKPKLKVNIKHSSWATQHYNYQFLN